MKNGVETVDIYRQRQEEKKENKKGKKSFDQLIEEYTNNEILRKELKNHLAIRKKSGNLTNRAIELGFDNLNILTKNIKNEEERNKEKTKIVQQSIANGWGGFFRIKEKDKIDKRQDVSGDLEGLYEN